MSEKGLYRALTKGKTDYRMCRVIKVKIFGFDLNRTIKVVLFGKEHLVPPRLHVGRSTPTYILYFVTQGELHLKVNGVCETLGAGDVYIFEKGDVQTPLESTDVRYYYVHFVTEPTVCEIGEEEYIKAAKKKNVDYAKLNNHGSCGYDYLRVSVKQKNCISNRESLEWLTKRFEKCANSFWSKSPENRFAISTDFAKILYRIENDCLKGNENERYKLPSVYDTVLAISEYISQNLNTDIGSNEIETMFSMNYDYINRNFKSVMGQSMLSYRNMLRIERAKLLLSTTDKEISDVAEEVGFGDKYYFVRYFKKKAGITPAAYRKRLEENVL